MKIAPNYEITGFLGHGNCASVLKGKYGLKDVAIKLQVVDESTKDKNFGLQRTKKEVANLQMLAGIDGIPQLIAPLLEVQGSYDSLGLHKSGLQLSDMVSDTYSHPRAPYFQTGLIMQYPGEGIEIIPRDVLRSGSIREEVAKIAPNYNWATEFFDRLEAVVRKVHERGLGLPPDISILNVEEKPYLLDWMQPTTLHPCSQQNKVQGDLAMVEILRDSLTS